MNRFYHITLAALFTLSPAAMANAQTAPTPEKPVPDAQSETKPAPKEDKKLKNDADIDAMFKRGEEQAKEGSTCHKPPEPIA